MVTALAGRYEVGEDAGLRAIASSVEQELAKSSGLALVRFSVQPPGGGQPFECEGLEGMSLKDIAEHGSGTGADVLRELLECACSGVMACSTCHVYLDSSTLALVGPPGDAEQDMLELAHEPGDASRLGCQVRLHRSLEGMKVTIPSGANNLFDHIPFD